MVRYALSHFVGLETGQVVPQVDSLRYGQKRRPSESGQESHPPDQYEAHGRIAVHPEVTQEADLLERLAAQQMRLVDW